MKIRSLLKPHARFLALGLIAAIGEGIADLLQPWPLKVVLDRVLKSHQTTGWLNGFAWSLAGDNSLSILRLAAFAAVAVAIAVIGALCAYVQKYLTPAGPWTPG